MSKLIVEVCAVDKVEPHENADKLAVATIKGWKVCITCDPVTKVAQFQEGEKCIFFPPDSILPLALCNGPNDTPKGRLGNLKYLHHLPKDEFGVRPEGGRVVACRLRGQVSYGVIMKIDPNWGDDPNWEVGQDVAEHFGVTKYDPPPPTNDGQAEKPSTFFHRYTEIENFANYPKAIEDGTEVVFTEKLHGCLEKNSIIQLYNGEEKQINQIKIGEKIRSFDGLNYVVDEVVRVIVKPVHEKLKWLTLSFDNGKKLTCTEDHLILTNNGWKAAIDLTEDDFIF